MDDASQGVKLPHDFVVSYDYYSIVNSIEYVLDIFILLLLLVAIYSILWAFTEKYIRFKVNKHVTNADKVEIDEKAQTYSVKET